MHDRILQTVKDFLTTHWIPGKPLLAGFSGGPDSLALLHLLVECRHFFPLDLQVAHVDHGWRPESSREAEQLREHAASLQLPFHLAVLKDLPPKEDVARKARLEFFKELYLREGCQALVLGHQGDDQSETVLKRVLEGASFSALGGIRQAALIEGMRIWRPLLGMEKSVLREWLQQKGLAPIDDSTNLDPRYLRGRMRTTILPELQRHFGKEIGENLRRLGASAQELSDYLHRRMQKYDELIQEDEERVWVDLSTVTPFEPLEIKAFLKKIGEKNQIFLSHEAVQTLYELLEKRAVKRKVGSQGRFMEVDGRCVAIKKK